MKTKIKILKALLGIIEDISNEEYQYRVWVKGLGPECSSFEDTMCNFFDDFHAMEILRTYKEYGITEKQYKILLQFYKKLDKYSDAIMNSYDYVNPELILKDPKWEKIRKMAKKVLKAFDYEKGA